MGKQLFSGLTVLILLFFAVSLTVGSVSAASDSTNSTPLPDPASNPVTSVPIITDPSIGSASASDLIKYLTPTDPNTGYLAIIDITRIEVFLEHEHIFLAYIPASDLKDGKIPDSYLSYLSDASGDSNPIDLSSLGISTTDLTGNPTIISSTAGDPVISDPVTSDPAASDPTNTGSSTNTVLPIQGLLTLETPIRDLVNRQRVNQRLNKSSTSSKPTTDSKKSTCKPTTSTKPAVSKTSTCKPAVSKTSTSKPATSKTSTCKPKATSVKPATNSKASTCKPRSSSSKPSTSSKTTKASTPKKTKC